MYLKIFEKLFITTKSVALDQRIIDKKGALRLP